MRDIKPLLLVLLSIGLVGTWVYHLYDKTQYTRQLMVLGTRDSLVIANAVRDSLTRHYSGTITELDKRLANATINSDSLQNRLNTRLQEIARLRTEIEGILGKGSISREEAVEANQKMELMQQKVSELNAEKATLEQQKDDFSVAVAQLSRNTDSLQQKVLLLRQENETLQRKVNTSGIFVASDLKLAAIDLRTSREQETNQVKKADKFVISFAVQNNSTDYSNAEVAIVIIQPDKQVLQNTKWESGSFPTPADGTKEYTRMVKFDYSRGEKHDLNFSLENDAFEKGSYVLQVWHKGVLIGQTFTGLN